MFKIGLYVEDKLELLIKETFDYTFINIKSYNHQKISDNHITLLIVDDTITDLYNYLKQCKSFGFKVLYMVSSTDLITLRKYLKEKLIFDFLRKINYEMIQECIDSLELYNNENSKLFIDDIFVKAWILPKNILYITYINHLRKSSIQTIENKIYLSRKKLSDIENLFFSFPEFHRIDRSNIINITHIKEINLKEEKLVFDNNFTLSLSKKKLKNLEVNFLNTLNTIKL